MHYMHFDSPFRSRRVQRSTDIIAKLTLSTLLHITGFIIYLWDIFQTVRRAVVAPRAVVPQKHRNRVRNV